MSTALDRSPFGAGIPRRRAGRAWTIVACLIAALPLLASSVPVLVATLSGADATTIESVRPGTRIIVALAAGCVAASAILALRRGEPRAGAGIALGMATAALALALAGLVLSVVHGGR